MKRVYEVWIEQEGKDDFVLFRGTKTAALSYYKKHGGAKAGLHIGYIIP